MPKYNTNFDLSLDDMKLIEAALRKAAALGDNHDFDVKAANELLGRLHNQKIFYRPRDRVYISG